MTATPSEASSKEASKTEVSGSLSITTDIAPTPMATPSISGSPGRCDSAMPPAAPTNRAGKVGPPRKLLRDTP
jgi:hypothetical protein